MAPLNPRLPTSPDAFSNLFVVDIKWNHSLLAVDPLLANDWRWRMKDFQPPTFTSDIQMVKFWSTVLPRQGSKMPGEPKFSLKFRLDSNYQLFLVLQKAKRLFAGTMATESAFIHGGPISSVSVKVPVKANKYVNTKTLDYLETTTDETEYMWIFRNVFVSEVSNPTFTTGEASLMEVDAEFYFDPLTSAFPYQFIDNQETAAAQQALTTGAATQLRVQAALIDSAVSITGPNVV